MRLNHLGLHLLDFRRKDYFSRRCRIDTRRLDGDDNVAFVFKEMMRVESDDTSLFAGARIRLSDPH